MYRRQVYLRDLGLGMILPHSLTRRDADSLPRLKVSVEKLHGWIAMASSELLAILVPCGLVKMFRLNFPSHNI